MKDTFEPDYNNVLKVLHNVQPVRPPLYEHNIDLPFIEKFIGEEIPFGYTPEDFKNIIEK
jgi:hypothetical protein